MCKTVSQYAIMFLNAQEILNVHVFYSVRTYTPSPAFTLNPLIMAISQHVLCIPSLRRLDASPDRPKTKIILLTNQRQCTQGFFICQTSQIYLSTIRI